MKAFLSDVWDPPKLFPEPMQTIFVQESRFAVAMCLGILVVVPAAFVAAIVVTLW